MNVELLSYTPDALNLLLTTKGTRLAHSEDPALWDDRKKADHLAYMRDTIKSSWEFVDYTFRISGVTRAFTHQLVRTRTGSYAQEAMRVVNAAGFDSLMPPSVVEAGESSYRTWQTCMEEIDYAYRELVNVGIPRQDARGVLPTNVLTNIIAKFNLRTLANMAELRLCTRTQGEYQNVFREMKRLVVEEHPWADEFINVFCANHAHCAFPRYGAAECPVYPATIGTEELDRYRAAIREQFNAIRYEACPEAVGGKAM